MFLFLLVKVFHSFWASLFALLCLPPPLLQFNEGNLSVVVMVVALMTQTHRQTG